MANTYYQAPASMDPRGEWQPQGFLAGFHYQDRLNDYRTARDIANTSGQLQNRQTLANLQDYMANAPTRQLERIRNQGALRNEIALQPGQHRINTLNQMGDEEVARYQKEFKVWNAMQQLPAAVRQKHIQELLTTSQMLRGVPPGQEWQALSMLKDAGVNTSRWDDNPAKAQKELSWLRGIDTEAFKIIAQAGIAQYEMGERRAMNREDNDTRLRVAEISQGRTSAAGARVERDQKMDARAREVLIKMGMSRGLNKEQAEDFADLQIWQTRARDAQYQSGARAQSSLDETEALLKTFQGVAPPKPQTVPTPDPSMTQGQPQPQAQPQSQYSPGQVYQGRTGTYRFKGGDPKDKNNWEKVD